MWEDGVWDALEGFSDVHDAEALLMDRKKFTTSEVKDGFDLQELDRPLVDFRDWLPSDGRPWAEASDLQSTLS